jgi:hypothetical protein
MKNKKKLITENFSGTVLIPVFETTNKKLDSH